MQGLLDFQRSYIAKPDPKPDSLPKEIMGGLYINGKFKKIASNAELGGAGSLSQNGLYIKNLHKILSQTGSPRPGSPRQSIENFNDLGNLNEIGAPGNTRETLTDKINRYHDFWKILEDHYTNPLSSVVVSQTMLLPHQVQAALHVIDSVRPRVLIADEVGLGKTIEAGLIIKELLLKYGYTSALVAVPAPLIYQWAAELKEKFNEDFTIITGPVLRRNPHILDHSSKIIVSIDLLRDPRHWEKFLERNYEVAVFDEAHRLRKDGSKTTRGYQFAEKVAAQCKALILLSATPFRGKIEEIYYLIQLIDPDILGPYHSFINQYGEGGGGRLKDTLSPVVIRRRKIEVGGFTRRFARTVKLTLNPLERAFYDAVSEYVRKEYNRALESEQTVRAFVMITFQKLLDSSCFAVSEALRKRKEKLEGIYFRHARPGESGEDANSESLFEIDPENPEFFDESDLGETPEEIIDSDKVFDPVEIRKEIFSLTRLIEMGKKIENDSKLTALKNSLQNVKKAGHEKIIIFTQFKKTLFYLEEHLKQEYQITVFHGGMSGREKEEAIEEFFKRTEILICTEAGGEGRNLQAATVLVNYDLPWSPLRVEQRIGRIHRFGQKSDVYILNFATKDTIAEKVIDILEKKILLFEDAFGGSDVLLGITEDDSGFERHIRELLGNKKTGREIEKEIESSARLAKDNLHRIDHLLSTEVMDFNMAAFANVLEKKESQSENQSLLEKMIEGERHSTGQNAGRHDGLYTFEFAGEIRRGSFSAELCENNPGIEFLTVGHPYVDSLLAKMVRTVESSPVYRAEGHTQGVLVYAQVQIHLDRVYNRVYRIFYRPDIESSEFSTPGSMRSTMPMQNIRLVQPGQPGEISSGDLEKSLRNPLAALQEKVAGEAAKIRKKIMPGVNYWKKNVNHAYSSRDGELGEKLEIQRGKSAWYGEQKMVGAISRTMNLRKNERQRATKKLAGLENTLKEKIEVEIRHICFIDPV